MNIVILAGGYSPERDVSLSSGSLIANALSKNGHRVLLLDVYQGLEVLPKSLESLFIPDRTYHYEIPKEVPDLEQLKASSNNGDALIGPNVLEICKLADIVFLALHGSMGENGQLQATLDNYGIRYTGSGYIGSLLAMDKDLAKRLLRDAEIQTPKWIYFDIKHGNQEDILHVIGLPCVVKPCSCGSSVGVSMVNTEEELYTAIKEASLWESHVLIEQRIFGRELTVGILDGQPLPPVEIIPNEGFYDYQNKYSGATREVCPAQIPDTVTKKAFDLTKKGFDALRLRGYARFDYLLDKDGTLWCLEANTLPGMTPTSLLPQAAAAVGISYTELCERIIQLAMK